MSDARPTGFGSPDLPPVLVIEDGDLLLHLAPALLDEDGCTVARGTARVAEALPAALGRLGAHVLALLLDGEIVGHAVAADAMPGSVGCRLRIILWTASTEHLGRATTRTARARLTLEPALRYDHSPLSLLRHALAHLALAG